MFFKGIPNILISSLLFLYVEWSRERNLKFSNIFHHQQKNEQFKNSAQLSRETIKKVIANVLKIGKIWKDS